VQNQDNQQLSKSHAQPFKAQVTQLASSPQEADLARTERQTSAAAQVCACVVYPFSKIHARSRFFVFFRQAKSLPNCRLAKQS
jgi:hypothetical protein